MSHFAFVKATDTAVETRLLRLLNQDAGWLYQERYQRGLDWLARWYDTSTDLYRALERHPLFWAWWVNGWQHRDQDFSKRLKVLDNGVACYTADSGGTKLFFRDWASLEEFYLSQHEPQKTRATLPRFITDEVRRELRKQGK